jgi:uncharacterized LabA/DUF88 family protein
LGKNDNIRLAVLIDADNVSSANIRAIMEEITKYGSATIRRIYGDWTRSGMNGWKEVLLEHAITPIQQYSYTTGKNATDSAMIIDAMDILYTGQVEGFCIISSDSDFTRLATRLREAGMHVLGIGEKKTPNPFVVACDKFVYIEIIKETMRAPETAVPGDVVDLITGSIVDVADENGWAFLGSVGNQVNLKRPDFDPRLFGFPKLTPLIKSIAKYEIDERESDKPGVKHNYVRIKTTG